ncbi:MAG: hypothetical protein JW776_08110 [Candidatus Lokiarchaeota archaeon]|nr:hypothetical protein [Candidatus Lokiarchaeota archaeon]
MTKSDRKEDIMKEFENLSINFLDLFTQKGTKETDRFEESYCYLVGSFSKQLRKLLDVYHEQSRDEQMKLKPSVLYYRELQQYLVYFVRFPSALYQKNHPFLKELQDLIEYKGYMIKTKFKKKAMQESQLFESDFREKLEKTLSRRRLRDGN